MIDLDDLCIPDSLGTLWNYDCVWYDDEKKLIKHLLKKNNNIVTKYDYLGECFDKYDVFMVTNLSYANNGFVLNNVSFVSEGIDYDNYEYLFETKNGFFWNGAEREGGIGFLFDIFRKYGTVFNDHIFHDDYIKCINDFNKYKKVIVKTFKSKFMR